LGKYLKKFMYLIEFLEDYRRRAFPFGRPSG
jgi:hypothetical protein